MRSYRSAIALLSISPRGLSTRMRGSARYLLALLEIRYHRPARSRSRPGGKRGQAHQHRVRIMAGLQPESRATIPDEVEFGIAPALHQLMRAVFLGPALVHAPARDRQERIQKGTPDIAGEVEITRPIQRAEIIIEDAADAPGLLAVADHEIIIRPFLEARIIARIVSVAGIPQLLVKEGGVLFDLDHRVQIGAAPEPPGARCPEHAGIHVHGRAFRRAHMRDQADAGSPEARILGQPRDLAPRGQRALRLRAEFAIDGRDIDADLLEAAPAHDRHEPAALIALALAGTPCFGPLESSGRQVGVGAGALFIFKLLESGADLVAQLAEPGAGARLPLVKHIRHLWAPDACPGAPNSGEVV